MSSAASVAWLGVLALGLIGAFASGRRQPVTAVEVVHAPEQPSPVVIRAPETACSYEVQDGDGWLEAGRQIQRKRRLSDASLEVRDGDGWFAIASKNHVDGTALLEANRATVATVIHPGDLVRLPTCPTTDRVVAKTATIPRALPMEPEEPTVPTLSTPNEGNGAGPTLCADGTVSGSSGRGSCSHHQGIAGGHHRRHH